MLSDNIGFYQMFCTPVQLPLNANILSANHKAELSAFRHVDMQQKTTPGAVPVS